MFGAQRLLASFPMVSPLSRRSRVATWAVGIVNALSRRAGRGAGTVAGGRVGLLFDRRLLSHLSQGRSVILVSGTNGKTTTSAMVRAGWSGDVTGNVTGANMPEGHVAALCASPAHRVVLETDEAWLASVVASTSPAVVVLLNLSRDQLDRANEVRQMAQGWRKCLGTEDFAGVVVANAADPLVVYAAEATRSVRWVDVPGVWRGDAASCPHCTRAVVFEFTTWWCTCGFAKPTDISAALTDELNVGGRPYVMDLKLPGTFNAANATFALTALSEVGVDVFDAVRRIENLDNVQGRYGLRRFGRRTVRLLLAKNPAGMAALLESLHSGGELWVAINAQIADGKDPSWLYDVPFEVLGGRRVQCLGERRLDLATRLSYDDVDCDVVDDIDALSRGEGDVTLVANYTAFREWTRRTTLC